MIEADSFEAMRAGLIERGLIGADLRLTEAGNDHVRGLIAELEANRDEIECGYAPIRWNTRRGVAK